MVINEVEQSDAICAACNQHIRDRYLFEVTNRKWHCVCLRCTHCKCPLTEKCWFRLNNLYCKDDYYKLFFSCSNCKEVIERDTYVRKASNMIYHLHCFQCNQCGKVLDLGDHYIVTGENKLLCSNHYPNMLSLSNSSKNSSTELITDQEGEIVVKTEQLNSSIDNQSVSNHLSSIDNLHPHFNSSLNMDTMSNAISHNHSSSFLLNRQASLSSNSLLPNSITTNVSTTGSLTTNSLIHSHHSTDLIPQSLSLIDYPSTHQPSTSSIITNDSAGTDSTDFYLNQSTTCYVPPPPPPPSSNPQLSSLSAPGLHSMNSIYEQDALRFYSANCLQQHNSMSAPQSNSPLNEIENASTSPANGNMNTARKGRPRKRKQIGLSSSNNTGIDAISVALHEQNLNNLNSNNTSSTIGQNLNAITSNGHLQSSNNSNSSSNSSNGNHQRTKRMRTSFKHCQLKTMKSFFARNQNPDGKDLKSLASETALTKRVLQVWFQNRRAQYRRHNHVKGDGLSQQNFQIGQTCLGSPDNGSTRQFSTPSPASIISNNSISNSNNQTPMQCEAALTATNTGNLCSNGSSSSLDQYSPSNSISCTLLRQTPPPSVKMPSSPTSAHLLTPSSLHFGHHLTGGHGSSNGLADSLSGRHLSNFSSEPIMSTFQDLY